MLPISLRNCSTRCGTSLLCLDIEMPAVEERGPNQCSQCSLSPGFNVPHFCIISIVKICSQRCSMQGNLVWIVRSLPNRWYLKPKISYKFCTTSWCCLSLSTGWTLPSQWPLACRLVTRKVYSILYWEHWTPWILNPRNIETNEHWTLGTLNLGNKGSWEHRPLELRTLGASNTGNTN